MIESSLADWFDGAFVFSKQDCVGWGGGARGIFSSPEGVLCVRLVGFLCLDQRGRTERAGRSIIGVRCQFHLQLKSLDFKREKEPACSQKMAQFKEKPKTIQTTARITNTTQHHTAKR